jgi:hypothetical protein
LCGFASCKKTWYSVPFHRRGDVLIPSLVLDQLR